MKEIQSLCVKINGA